MNSFSCHFRINGIRRSVSSHDRIGGISHSGILSRPDPFGSGRNVLTQFFQEANLGGQPWLQASTLGYVSQEDINDRYLKKSEDKVEMRTVVTQGTEIHRLLQRALASSGQIEGVEVPVSDFENKVYGDVDVLLKGNIPLEIKTVGSVKDLRNLTAAKESAISQANFYAIALKAPYAFVLYGTREDSNETKIFRVPVDYERYRRDIARLRAGIQALPGDPIRHNTLALNLSNLYSHILSPGGLIHPKAGIAPSPYEQMEMLSQIGDYGKRFSARFREGNAGRVQFLDKNAIRSRFPSQKMRISAYNCKSPNRQTTNKSRRDRRVTSC